MKQARSQEAVFGMAKIFLGEQKVPCRPFRKGLFFILDSLLGWQGQLLGWQLPPRATPWLRAWYEMIVQVIFNVVFFFVLSVLRLENKL